MAGNPIGPIGQAWLKWKSLRLPWRKRFLVGFDLQGNTYWEFRLTTRGTGEAAPNGLGEVERWRRIVQYPRGTHLSSVKVGPLWHQWLRYTRRDPPSLDEQRGDVVRRARMKQLAADADARWAAKPRVMEDPLPRQQAALPTATEAATMTTKTSAQEPVTLRAESKQKAKTQRDEAEDGAEEAVDPKDPWKQARTRGPSEEWQPQAWSPKSRK
ncbi:NADH-ubiquinone oxidoreductase assembly factor N7BML [Beauveria bassiana]|nr:NADH-ubiquinone oxidoreductase assembly factor N7BML [Beauveria bassiana]KAH8709662.1 NADH-ubiquinone oxidoreductase assembly factor N7BML [Beauveria bassiana]